MIPALTSGGWHFRDSSEWQHLCLVLLSFQPRHPHPAALGLWQWGLRDNAESWKDESIHSFPWIPGDVMLGVDILHSRGGRNKGCLYAAAGSKPGMEPLWMPPPWSRKRGRAETEITTRTGRFHATSLDCLCQTTNNITMLQQNFSAPSPGRHKIHQKCWWPALEIFLSWLAYNKTCRISFLLLLIFVGIFFFFSLPCTQSWSRSTVLALPLCEPGAIWAQNSGLKPCPGSACTARLPQAFGLWVCGVQFKNHWQLWKINLQFSHTILDSIYN